VLVAGATLVVVPATAAAAHNVLISTDPADGSTVATAPDAVVMTFDQPALALGTELVVTAPGGGNVADGPPQLVDNTVRQPVAGTLPAGTYTVQWRVTSADGHPVSGSFRFTTTQQTSRQPQHPVDPATAPATAYSASGGSKAPTAGIVIGAFVVVVGLVWFGRRRRRGARARARDEGSSGVLHQ
jgi:methionine-rich copper-binding protein CopC